MDIYEKVNSRVSLTEILEIKIRLQRIQHVDEKRKTLVGMIKEKRAEPFTIMFEVETQLAD